MEGDNGYSKMWTRHGHGQHGPQGGRLIEVGWETLKRSVHADVQESKATLLSKASVQ